MNFLLSYHEITVFTVSVLVSPLYNIAVGDSNGTVGHVENETKSSALVELLKRHIRTIERITGMKLMSRSIMTIIVSSSIFEPS